MGSPQHQPEEEMGAFVNLEGQTVGRWKVQYRCEPPEGKRGTYWMCKCSCEAGTVKPVAAGSLQSHLKNPDTGSSGCGCSRKGHTHRRVHGQAKQGPELKPTPTYESWRSMKKRCTCSRRRDWHLYGGRKPHPVRVCTHLQDFVAFEAVLGERPSKTTLDRINSSGPNSNYSCGQCGECKANGWTMNCLWATSKQQARNKSNTVWAEADGEKIAAVDLAEQTEGAVTPRNVSRRIKKGEKVDAALFTPIRETHKRVVSYKGEEWEVTALAKEKGIQYTTLLHRLDKGIPVEEAVDTPVRETSPPEANERPVLEGEETTVHALSQEFNIPYGVLYSRLYQYHWPVERAVSEPVRGCERRSKVEWRGELRSVQQIADLEGIDASGLRKRLSQGLTMQEAVETIKRNQAKQPKQ